MGELYLLISFYVSRNWKITFGFYAIFSVISCILFCTLIPESPKWLKTKGNYDDLYKVLDKIGKMNGIKYLDKNELENESIANKNEINENCEDLSHKSNFKLLEIIWPAKNLFKIIKLIILWNSNALNYIGIFYVILNFIF